jgi:hypothetical protein
VDPQTQFPTEGLYTGGITAFIGATVFEIGSVLLMFEAVNENRTGCFGWALEKIMTGSGHEHSGKTRLKPEGCNHHHQNTKNFVGKGPNPVEVGSSADSDDSGDVAPDKDGEGGRSWQWFPSWYDLRTHYFRELGFLACSAQLFGASVFWISGFTALPGIQNVIPSQGLLDGIFWVPQVIGGSGFIASGLLFMLETQPKWYIPAPKTLGWHIGLWNLIGAVGFTVSPCHELQPPRSRLTCFVALWSSWKGLQ